MFTYMNGYIYLIRKIIQTNDKILWTIVGSHNTIKVKAVTNGVLPEGGDEGVSLDCKYEQLLNCLYLVFWERKVTGMFGKLGIWLSNYYRSQMSKIYRPWDKKQDLVFREWLACRGLNPERYIKPWSGDQQEKS